MARRQVEWLVVHVPLGCPDGNFKQLAKVGLSLRFGGCRPVPVTVWVCRGGGQ
jgi:hypothetical protein